MILAQILPQGVISSRHRTLKGLTAGLKALNQLSFNCSLFFKGFTIFDKKKGKVCIQYIDSDERMTRYALKAITQVRKLVFEVSPQN